MKEIDVSTINNTNNIIHPHKIMYIQSPSPSPSLWIVCTNYLYLLSWVLNQWANELTLALRNLTIRTSNQLK